MPLNTSWCTSIKRHKNPSAIGLKEIIKVSAPIVMSLTPEHSGKNPHNFRSNKVNGYSINEFICSSKHIVDQYRNRIRCNRYAQRKQLFNGTQIHACATIMAVSKRNERGIVYCVPSNEYQKNLAIMKEYGKK